MLKQEDIDKIERFIDGQANDSEKAWVESLFLNGEDNYTLRNSLEKNWIKMLSEESHAEVNLSHLLDRVHHVIRKNEIMKRQKPLQKLIRIYVRAAAILLFPLLIAGLIYSYLGSKVTTEQSVSSSIYAPLGARVSFKLPDGTSGILNSGSHLSYSIPFTNHRQIKLEGEAWFEVNHNEDHPFEISAGNSTVRVLGTRFNMSAYPEENYIEVVLQQGKVEFLDKKNDKKVIMLPLERLVFQNGNISKSITDPTKYNAWTEGKLVFRGDPMAEVTRRIERWYNVKVNLADKELENYSFRAIFLDDSLADVLKLLSMTSPIRYRITPRVLMEDGTYKKEEVTIYLK
jgi:transmembrane sensor